MLIHQSGRWAKGAPRCVRCSGRAGTSAAPPCRRSVSVAPRAELSPAASPCVPRTHTHTHTQRTHARKHVHLSFWLDHPRAMAVCPGLFVCASAHMHTMTYPSLPAYVHTHLSGALICVFVGYPWEAGGRREGKERRRRCMVAVARSGACLDAVPATRKRVTCSQQWTRVKVILWAPTVQTTTRAGITAAARGRCGDWRQNCGGAKRKW